MSSEYGNYGKTGNGFSLGNGKLADMVELLHLSLKLQLGKYFWAWPLLPLIWPLFNSFLMFVGESDPNEFGPGEAQNMLIGVPVYFLAIAIGMQIISSEIESRTLEVCYTVPGGAQRIWLSKLTAALFLIIPAILILALYTRLVFTDFPLAALYRVLQGALFYLVVSMGAGALFRNKMTAGMACVVMMFFNGALTGFGEIPTRYSPLFNPAGLAQSMSAQEVLYFLLQNHLGYAMIIVMLVVLTFSRTERRELMLSDD
jgi:ABC-type transport system involved in multi-copper enzyme maturation permease subunit